MGKWNVANKGVDSSGCLGKSDSCGQSRNTRREARMPLILGSSYIISKHDNLVNCLLSWFYLQLSGNLLPTIPDRFSPVLMRLRLFMNEYWGQNALFFGFYISNKEKSTYVLD